LALAVLTVALAAFLAIAWIARVWFRLNIPVAGPRLGVVPGVWRGWVYLLGLIGPYVGLIAAAALLWVSHPGALGWLADVEGWLLVMGTVAAWVMLSHAGGAPDTGDAAGG
jgi:hypothetical protein